MTTIVFLAVAWACVAVPVAFALGRSMRDVPVVVPVDDLSDAEVSVLFDDLVTLGGLR